MFYFPLFDKHHHSSYSSNIISDVLCPICIPLFLCYCPNLSVILLFLFFALFSYGGAFFQVFFYPEGGLFPYFECDTAIAIDFETSLLCLISIFTWRKLHSQTE